MRFIPQHEVVQKYGAILPDNLTTQAMKESKAYKTYYAFATGKAIPKPKYVRRTTKEKTVQAPKASSGKRIKSATKVTRSGKKKQLAKGLETLSEIALSEAEQMKLAIERSKTQLHSSQPSGSGAHEGTGVTPGVPDVPTYGSDDEQISWKSSDEEDDDDEANIGKDEDDDDQDNDDDQGDEDERIDSDNDGDDFVHPKFSTHDEEDKEEDSFDPRVQTPSHVESTNDEDSDEEIQGANVEGDEQDEEETNEEVEANELYRDVNINLVGRDTEMTDAPRTIIQTTQVIEDTHVIITPVNPEGQQQSSSVSSGFVSNMLNPSPDTGIDSIFNLNTESTSLIDVPVTTIAEPPLLSATTLPPPPTPLITHLQQTPVPTPATVPSSSLQDLPNFGSLFGFDHRLKTLENDFSEFKQTNQFAAAISSILRIVDTYLANKMSEAVKTTVQLQSDRLRDEAQAENEDFINKLNDNIKKIIKDQVKEQVKAQVSKILPKIEKTVNEQLEAEVLTRSSNESKTSHAVAANLSELELKKILIDKMESNKSIHRSDEQKNLYKALVDAYESDKLILDTYGETVSFKRQSTNAPKEKTSKTTGKSTEGSKSHHKSTDESAQAEEPMQIAKDLKEPTHQDFKIGVTEDQPDEHTSQLPDWEFSRDVYSKRRIIALIVLQIVKWHNYKHLDWITVRRDDDKLYKFKEGDFKRLHIQDIEDISIAIQRHVEDLQLGIESYQKKFNHTKPDTYRSDLKRREAYTAYSNPRGFIYQNKDKKNRLMRIDELYKFSDGTLNDVRTSLDDHLKGIWMQYLPHTIWRESDRDKARAIIQAIDKQLNTRRIMWSLEKFVSGRSYEGDFWLLQRTI
ncbi:hypothetical protein Tco_1245679 [Tanacetum coccineum]